MSERHVIIGMTPTEDTTRIPMYLDVSRIVEAVSPHVTLTQTDDGVVITVEDIDGTKTATVYDGAQGETGPQGVPGQDGFSPSATVTQTATGATISITDARGTTTANVTNGQDGAPGQDGVSPEIAVTDTTGGHRVTIADAQGTETFDVMDGADGQDGEPGVGVPAGGTAGQVLSKASGTDYDTEWTTPSGGDVTDVQVNGTSIVTDGVANVPVASAVDKFGVIKVNTSYGLNVYASGLIRIWGASSSDIKGGTHQSKPIVPDHVHESAFYGLAKAAGADMKNVTGDTFGVYPEAQKSAIHEMLNAPVTVTGTTPTITALPGVRYVCSEVVTTLDITLPASGCIDVVFESGSTATALTITPPTGVTLKWANGFDPTSLEANTTYEINICDGLGVAASWT